MSELKTSDAEILEWVNGYPTTEETLESINKLPLINYSKDVDFVTSYIKGMFVEDILKAMEEKNIKKIDLAEKIGKSRQYVGRVLNESANFTIRSMVEIAIALNMDIEVKCNLKGY